MRGESAEARSLGVRSTSATTLTTSARACPPSMKCSVAWRPTWA